MVQTDFVLDHDVVSGGVGGAYRSGNFLPGSRLDVGLALATLDDRHAGCTEI